MLGSLIPPLAALGLEQVMETSLLYATLMCKMDILIVTTSKHCFKD